MTNLICLIETKCESYEQRLSEREKYVEKKDEENDALPVKVRATDVDVDVPHAKMDKLRSRSTLVFSDPGAGRPPAAPAGARPGDPSARVGRPAPADAANLFSTMTSPAHTITASEPFAYVRLLEK